jgi:hypothetical protein
MGPPPSDHYHINGLANLAIPRGATAS